MIASRPVRRYGFLRVFLAAAGLVFLTSCPQSIPELRGAVSIRLVSPEGRVLSQSASRTILPDFAHLVGSIEINRYAPGGTEPLATHPVNNLENTTLADITLADIDPGSWEFEAKLYFAGVSEPFATGRSAATTIQEGTSPTVNIQLAYQHGTETGSCTITVSWPVTDADALSWELDALNDSGTITDSMTSAENIYTDSSTRSATIAITNVQAGAHRLVLAFSNAGENAGVFTESVNIFPGVAADKYIQAGGTTATISFGTGRLLDTNASLASLTLEGLPNEHSGLVPGFSSTNSQYAVEISGVENFTFTPIRSIAGQKIVYTWNGGAGTNILSGAASTSLSIGASATNTLVITVRAPNGSATQTYTVRFVNSADIGWELNPVYTHLSLTANETTVRLQRASPGTATVTGTYTTGMDAGSYIWYSNGQALPDNPTMDNDSNWSDSFNAEQTYNLSYTATKDGLLYSSNTIVITVLPAATLVYNGNGHSGGTVPTWSWGTSTVAAQGDMVKSGYQFVGWSTDRTGRTADDQFEEGDAIPAAVTNNTDNAVLYAIWENVAPPPVTNVVITPLSDSLKVTWQDPDVADLKEVEIRYTHGTNGSKTITVPAGMEYSYLPDYIHGTQTVVAIRTTDLSSERSDFVKSGAFPLTGTFNSLNLKDKLEQFPAGLFILEDNITLNDWTAAGSEAAPFNGIFNGNGHTITIIDNSSSVPGGLFASVAEDGVVRNLIINLDADVDAGDCYGGITAHNSGLIECCAAQGRMINKQGYLGGIAGINHEAGIIRSCYSTINIDAKSYYVGGVAGTNRGRIENSYARGNIHSVNGGSVGGLVGNNESSAIITNSYSTGDVDAASQYAGFVGNNTASVFLSFYDKDTSGHPNSSNGTPTATADMKNQSSFTDWDFDNVWAIDPNINDGYPYLRYFGAATATP